LLTLLGWRLHRVQRRSAVRDHARDIERRGEERLRALVRHSSDVVAVIDASSRIQWIAESVERVLGHDAARLTGRPLSDLVHLDDVHRALRFLRHALEHENAIERESLRLRTSTGAFRQVELMAENRLADPLVAGILLNLRDVSQRIALEEQLRHQAFHDTLTSLANRALFEDRLTQALARERRHDGTMAVLFIDLDDFKTSTTASAMPSVTRCCRPSPGGWSTCCARRTRRAGSAATSSRS
jgi:PAS domain S-box-containing protein